MNNTRKSAMIMGTVLIMGLIGGVVYYAHGSIEVNNTKNNGTKATKTTEAKPKEGVVVVEGDYDYMLPGLKGHDVVICSAKSIDKSDNRNPATKKYYNTISSFGMLEIKKVLQGKLKKGDIPFTAMGGRVSMEKYYQGMNPRTQKRLNRTKYYTKDEMKKIKVEHDGFGTIKKLETGNDFVCYLKYNKDFGTYHLISLPEILREVVSYGHKNNEFTVRDVDKNGGNKKGRAENI